MIKIKYLHFTTLFFIFFACEDSKTNPLTLSESQKKWESHNFKSYRMKLSIACYCIPPHDIDIRVENNRISLINTGDLSFPEPDLKNKFWHAKTVDDLFSFINEKLSDDPYQKTLKFNSTYGYPEEIFFDMDEMIADEEIGYTIHSFNSINNGCIDSSKISNNACIEIYDPVCGCDGVTYSNSCKASVAGVTASTPGVCNK